MTLAQKLGYKAAICFFLEGLAESASGQRQLARAVRLWSAADMLRTNLSTPLEPADKERYQEIVHAVRTTMGEEIFVEMWEAERSKPLEQVIAYALSEDPSDNPIAAEISPSDKSSALLSQREWEVATLIAAGHANREAASKLAIAQRTVDTHVSHMLTKLGFTSRAQIIALVEEQQLRKV